MQSATNGLPTVQQTYAKKDVPVSDTGDGPGVEARREPDFLAAAPCVLLAAGIAFCAAVLMVSTVSICAQCVIELMPPGERIDPNK